MSSNFKKVIVIVIIFFGFCWFFLINSKIKYTREIIRETGVMQGETLSELMSCRCIGIIINTRPRSDGQGVQKCLGFSFDCGPYTYIKY